MASVVILRIFNFHVNIVYFCVLLYFALFTMDHCVWNKLMDGRTDGRTIEWIKIITITQKRMVIMSVGHYLRQCASSIRSEQCAMPSQMLAGFRHGLDELQRREPLGHGRPVHVQTATHSSF